jgi:hypothetical protein
MSTKTLRKRIALVAVSALGAGLLSVVSVSPANAGATDATAVNANVTTGVGTSTGSVGLLAESGEGTTQTAVLLATGAISTTYTGVTVTATVTGGRFTAATNATISGTSSASATASSNSSTAVSLQSTPNSGATSMVITYSANAVVVERITVTIVATSAYNKYSGAYSYAYWGDGAGADTSTTDSTESKYVKASGGILAGDIALLDAYGNLLTTSNLGMLTATVTAGALVNLGSASVAGSTTIDYQTVTGGLIPFNVQQADVEVPWNGTVTISFDGVVVATKSGILKGEVASVTATSPKIGKSGTASNLAAATIAYADSAGNVLYPTSGTSAVSSTLNGTVTGLSVGTYPISGTPGAITMSCGSGTLGAVKGLQVQHLNASGTVVKSNTWDSGCADVPYTVAASWDRVSYVPGSVATLTLAFKDRFGNVSNAYDAISANSAAAILTVTGGPSAAAITPIAASDKPSGVTGAKTYQFVVGTTEGDYVAVIVPTEIQENTTARGVTTANISLPYSVKSTSTAVSNADVLKAIVSLIASINKQIAALQKALLKK